MACPTDHSTSSSLRPSDIRFGRLDFAVDKPKLQAECDSTRSSWHELPTLKRFLDAPPFDVVPRALLAEMSYLDDRSGHVEFRTYRSWQGCSLTHLPNEPASRTGTVRLRNRHKSAWSWRGAFPYLQHLCETLGFHQLHTVRVLALAPGSFGPVHIDDPRGDYYRDDCVSVTVNVADGGARLLYLDHGRVCAAEGDCFIFADDCWHGVTMTSKERLQLRISGRAGDRLRRFLRDGGIAR
jgi:hypothetical protein